MNQDLMISGFSDEISSEFDTQLEVVSKLGMHYISLRGIDGKNIGDFTVEEVKETVLPRLQKWKLEFPRLARQLVKCSLMMKKDSKSN